MALGRQPGAPGLVFGPRGFYHKIQTPEEAFKKIDAVTAQDVQKVARELFQSKKMTLAVIRPYKNDKMFKKLLNV